MKTKSFVLCVLVLMNWGLRADPICPLQMSLGQLEQLALGHEVTMNGLMCKSTEASLMVIEKWLTEVGVATDGSVRMIKESYFGDSETELFCHYGWISIDDGYGPFCPMATVLDEFRLFCTKPFNF